MHGDVKRIQFYLMGLAVVIITVLQLLLIVIEAQLLKTNGSDSKIMPGMSRLKASTITSRAVRRSFRSIRTRLT